MKRIIKILPFLCLCCFSCNDEDNLKPKETEEVGPSVTIESNNVRVVSAFLKGKANIETIKADRMGVTKYGFIISQQSNPTKENGWIIKSEKINYKGEYTVIVTNLLPNTTYYFCSVFYDGAQYQYGSVKNFTTTSFKEDYLDCYTEINGYNVTFNSSINQEKLGYLTDFADRYKYLNSGSSTGIKKNYTNDKVYKITHINRQANEGAEYTYTFSIIYKDNYGNEIVLGNTQHTYTIPTDICVDEVDLGLSVIWKGTNIGAATPDEVGNLYAWGEIETKTTYTKENYLYDINSKIGTPITEQTYDITETEYDVVKKELGSDWVMPNSDQIKELVDSCIWDFIQYKGHYGYKGTSIVNGKTIFIPSLDHNKAYLWGSTIYHDKYDSFPSFFMADYYMANLSILTDQDVRYGGISYQGRPIRGVKKR